ncbi:3-dehydroquinate synthase II [Myceligenerans halotolerans]
MRLCWIDIRDTGDLTEAVTTEAIHQRVSGVIAAEPAVLADLPPTVTRVLIPRGAVPEDLTGVDVLLVDVERHGDTRTVASRHPDVEVGRYVDVVDAPTLEEACSSAREESWTYLVFRDPTKIPLEIVLAAAGAGRGEHKGRTITQVADVTEAEVVFTVLEHGSDGVAMAPRAVGEVTALQAAATSQPAPVDLVELTVTGTAHIGIGERACVDTTAYFGKDEGILVGSHSKGMILCVSETHPLPYMPTRPFRVNAGAIHSYTMSADGRTNYLSELHAGSKVLAVDVKGRTRLVTVGRVKIESRPLISVDAVGPQGEEVNLILQDDWHVRVLGPGDTGTDGTDGTDGYRVLNSTELRNGDRVWGYLPREDRHVGYAINEFSLER